MCDYMRTVPTRLSQDRLANRSDIACMGRPESLMVADAGLQSEGRQSARAARRTRRRHEQKWHRSSGFAFCCRRASGPAARQCRVWRETLGRIGGKGNSSKGLGRGRGELWGVVPRSRARQEAWYNCLGFAPASQVLEILQAPRSDQELALPRAIATCGGVARLAEVCCSRVWLMAMDPVHSKMTKDDRAECCVTRG